MRSFRLHFPSPINNFRVPRSNLSSIQNYGLLWITVYLWVVVGSFLEGDFTAMRIPVRSFYLNYFVLFPPIVFPIFESSSRINHPHGIMDYLWFICVLCLFG